MLLNFRVANFRSINEMVVLSMVPSDIKNQMNVIHRTNPNATKNKEYYGLTSAAIYGANASGKSNIIKALSEFMSFIIHSSENKPNEAIKLYKPFRLNDQNIEKPSIFSIDLLVDDIKYKYYFEINNKNVLKEELNFYPKGLKVKIFERNNQNIIKGNGYDGVFETIKQRTNENQLFLSKASTENIEVIKNFYISLSSIFVLTADVFHSSDFNKSLIKSMTSILDPEYTKDVFNLNKSLINKIDTQVFDYNEKDGVINTFHLNYKNEKVEFQLEDESSGTQRIISFMPLILIALKYKMSIIVDEFERSLHPDIAQYILSLFNDPEVNKNGAQFIFATHDTTLLSPENKLRRDQINLVEKNSNGETELYSISDIKGIREGNFEKWYLEGRFGAVPNIARETFRHELIDFVNS